MFFFFNDTATTEIYTLSLHDALPIFAREREQLPGQLLSTRRGGLHLSQVGRSHGRLVDVLGGERCEVADHAEQDRKSTRLNSSHANISYAVFCLKKKKKIHRDNYS